MIFLNNNFYYDNYKQSIALCVLLGFIVFLQFAFLIYFQGSQQRAVSFATTYDNKLIRLIPLNERGMTNSELLDWVKNATIDSYTFNFVNWKEALNEKHQYYSSTGYQHYLRVLNESKALNDVQTQKLVVAAIPTGAPVVLEEGIINQKFSWQIEMPISLLYQGVAVNRKQNLTITMLVNRVSNLESEQGLTISQLIVTENKRI